MDSTRIDMRRTKILFTLLLLVLAEELGAQIEASLISLRRGALWTSFYPGKECLPFSNWTRLSYGLDWPGYEPSWVGANVGGAASHLHTGGFWIASKDDSGRIVSIEDWGMYAGGVTTEPGAKYIVKRHERRWKHGENHWLQADPKEAEEIIDTEWEMNPSYLPTYAGERQLPLRATRTVRQWAGSQLDENYIIVEYVLKNISDSLKLREAYIMLTYALAPNTRGWTTMLPQLNQGARNVLFNYNSGSKLMLAYAEDYPGTSETNEKYDYYSSGGPNGTGEYLAPGYVGFRLLYSTPDTIAPGTPTRVNKVAWVAVPDAQDLYGPFGSASAGNEGRFAIVRDPSSAPEAQTGASDTRTSKRRWSLMTLGPYNMNPKDSIRIVVAEFVAGPSYADSIANPLGENVSANQIGNAAQKALTNVLNRTTLVYNNKNNIPDPPMSPDSVTILPPTSPKQVVNIIEWKNNVEAVPDRDYSGVEAYDLAGYRIYQSAYLPIGPWKLIAQVKKGDPKYLTGTTYRFVDTTVVLGSGYYYAVTSYDTGHATWPPNPAIGKVPGLESSIYASLYAKSCLDPGFIVRPFRATIPSSVKTDSILVVPNPFVLSSGSTIPDEASIIKFVHVPSPCTMRIYTVRGDLVKTVYHNDGSGIIFWNQQTDYGQFVGSGMYIYHISDTPSGEAKVGKFAIVR